MEARMTLTLPCLPLSASLRRTNPPLENALANTKSRISRRLFGTGLDFGWRARDVWLQPSQPASFTEQPVGS